MAIRTDSEAVMVGKRIVVVGADGFIGGSLATALEADRVVYGPAQSGDTHVNDAATLIGQADVIVNCGGFRVTPGRRYDDYHRSHEGSTSALVRWVRTGATFFQISSVAVLGRGKASETPVRRTRRLILRRTMRARSSKKTSTWMALRLNVDSKSSSCVLPLSILAMAVEWWAR